MLTAALVAAAVLAGAYFASQAGHGTTAAQGGASTPTATPGTAVVFGTPPPGAERGTWTPVPRCPEPTPTPTPPPRDAVPTATPGVPANSGQHLETATPRSAVVFGTLPPGIERGNWTPVPRCPEPTPTPAPDGWILTTDGWIFAPDRWTPAPAASPAPWPCVPYDEPTPPPGDPNFPLPTRPPQLTAEEKARIKAENPSSSTAVDYPRQFPVGGGKTVTVPAGAIFYTLTSGRMFHVVERGESRVWINPATGAI